jgi:hypothetical protein
MLVAPANLRMCPTPALFGVQIGRMNDPAEDIALQLLKSTESTRSALAEFRELGFGEQRHHRPLVVVDAIRAGVPVGSPGRHALWRPHALDMRRYGNTHSKTPVDSVPAAYNKSRGNGPKHYVRRAHTAYGFHVSSAAQTASCAIHQLLGTQGTRHRRADVSAASVLGAPPVGTCAINASTFSNPSFAREEDSGGET